MPLPVLFGANVDPSHAEPAAPLRAAERIERSGLDLITIQDHPYRAGFYDTWTLLTYLAARTSRVTFVPTVANLPLRPPAMLAKAAATLDVLSGGRFELGLGAGAFWDAIAALGGPVRRPGEALAALEEAVQVIRLYWSGQRGIRFEGQHYTLAGAQPGPLPAHPIGIWLGVMGPRALALAGRLADGVVWSTSYVPPARLTEMNARVDEAAEAAGRAPGQVRRVYNLMGLIGGGPGTEGLSGPVARWVDELSGYALEHGVDTFIFWPLHDPIPQLERFGQEIVPAVREAVARARAQA
jgi:alkanesulfonate monooxygenase SsuD/methylene tetrahydromethanopterin reductase-like flavin-dependent oxidoreductase (luciferase family)